MTTLGSIYLYGFTLLSFLTFLSSLFAPKGAAFRQSCIRTTINLFWPATFPAMALAAINKKKSN